MKKFLGGLVTGVLLTGLCAAVYTVLHKDLPEDFYDDFVDYEDDEDEDEEGVDPSFNFTGSVDYD